MNTIFRQIGKSALLGLALSLLPLSVSAQKKLEDRVVRLERLLESGALIDMHNQQEHLRQALQEIQADLDQIKRDLTEVKQRQHDLYLDTDRRLQQLERVAAQPTTAPVDDPEDQKDQPAADSTVADPTAARDDYQAALASLRAGRYAEATTAFQSFLQRYPEDHYTANALYWLGESYYVVRDFPNAMSAFQRVFEEYASSPKSPDALLKIGFIHHEQGDLQQARQVLNKVRSDFPDTTAARLAEQRLQRL